MSCIMAAESSNSAPTRKTIFIISDSTGETAKLLASRVLVQFSDLDPQPDVRIYPMVKTPEAVSEVLLDAQDVGSEGLVMATLVETRVAEWTKRLCEERNIQYIDVLGPVLQTFTAFLDRPAAGVPGGVASANSASSISPRRISKMVNDEFFGMVEAVQFGRQHISGLNRQGWPAADLLLLGVSRVGKGSIANYLASRGLKVACLTLAPEDPLPLELENVPPRKIVVLMMHAEVLQQVRRTRLRELGRKGLTSLLEDNYADLTRIKTELEYSRQLVSRRPEWSVLDCTYMGVEDSASVLNRVARAAKVP